MRQALVAALVMLLAAADAVTMCSGGTPAASPMPPRRREEPMFLDEKPNPPASSPKAGTPYEPSHAQLLSHEARKADLTLSPTPLYSTFSRIDPAFETDDGAAAGAVFLPNVALNASCMLSSSGSASGTFCRITEDGQTLATASEESPFVVVNLEDVFFVDLISFAVDVDAREDARGKLLVWCAARNDLDMTRESVDGLPFSWRKELLHDSSSLSLHVRAPCSHVRIQRKSFGSLRVHDLHVFGAKIKNPECASDGGSGICNGRGTCQHGACTCAWGFSGPHCDTVLMPGLAASSAQAALLVLLFVVITMRCRSVGVAALTGRSAAEDAGFQEMDAADAPAKLGRSSSSSNNSGGDDDNAVRDVGALSAIPPAPALCPVRASSLFDDDCLTSKSMSSLLPPVVPEGDLHMLFASPLIMTTSGSGAAGFRPIQGLDIQREHLLLRRSLRNAALALGGLRGSEVPVSVSCATVEAFHTLMTVGTARCLHFSGHCTSEFIAFEDAAGQLHSVSMEMLRGLLRSTVTARSFTTLRLVVLNACTSEAAAREFVLAGVAHVIAYRKRVRDVSAATFTRAFYLALACGRTVQDAFDSAKEAVQSAPSFVQEELDSFVLMPERASHSEIIWRRDARTRKASRRWPECERMHALPPLCEDFVGRHAATWALLRHLQVDRRRVVAVHGPAGCGKTQLALAVAHYLHQRRSGTVMRDGIFFVRAPPAALAHARIGHDEDAMAEATQLAALVDALWETTFPMLAEEANPMARARSCPAPGHAAMGVDDEEEEQDASQHGSWTHDAFVPASRAREMTPLLPLPAGETASALRRRADAKAAVLTQLCVQRSARCLIVLDDVHESAAVADMLAQLLERCAGVRVLLTGRAPFTRGDALSVNVVNYQVQPLQAGDAALLLARHLKRKLVDAEAHELSLMELAQEPGLLARSGNPRAIIQAALALSAAADVHEAVRVEALNALCT